MPTAGRTVDERLTATIRSATRTGLSPRHVPDRIVDIRAVPTTLSGKKLELPVKRVLSGADPDDAASRGALSDPAAWDEVVAAVERLRAG